MAASSQTFSSCNCLSESKTCCTCSSRCTQAEWPPLEERCSAVLPAELDVFSVWDMLHMRSVTHHSPTISAELKHILGRVQWLIKSGEWLLPAASAVRRLTPWARKTLRLFISPLLAARWSLHWKKGQLIYFIVYIYFMAIDLFHNCSRVNLCVRGV